jgi:hypothetical protein
MEFAVRVPFDTPDRARWVLEVDGERLLLAGNDQVLYWVAMADCRFVKAASPDQPRLVIPVQPQPQSGLARVQPTIVRGNHQ